MENEREILIAFQKGDKSAFYKIYGEYKNRVYSLIYNIVKNREKAEDIFQEVFLNVFKNKKKIDPSRPFWPYLRRICLNATFSFLRKEKASVSIEKIAELIYEDLILKKLSDKELVNLILKKLPPSQRMVLILQKFEGYSLKDISSELDISVKAVESLLSRAGKNIIKIYRLIEERNNRNKNYKAKEVEKNEVL